MRPRPTSKGRASRRSQGFTLLELMVVIIIVMVVAALAMPGVTSAISEQRTQEAALDLVRLARRARSKAMAYGRAHVVRFTGNDEVELWRGINGGCNTNDWAGQNIQMGGGVDCGQNDMCVDKLSMQADHYANVANIQMQLTNALQTPVDICYQPYGTVQWRDGGNNRFTDANTAPVDGGFRITFTPNEGVQRLAVLPLGGDPRIIR